MEETLFSSLLGWGWYEEDIEYISSSTFSCTDIMRREFYNCEFLIGSDW